MISCVLNSCSCVESHSHIMLMVLRNINVLGTGKVLLFFFPFPLRLHNVCLSVEFSLKTGSGVLESLIVSSLFKTRHKWCKETDQKRQRIGHAAFKLVQQNIRVIFSIVI